MAIGKRFNPQLASKGNQENKRNTKDLSDWKTESLNKKPGRVENKFASKNSFSYLKQTTKSEIKHNNKFSLKNLNEKQTKINDMLKRHKDKSADRNKKWTEKSEKKQKRKVVSKK
ncbi:hypothetical protein [Spiroplasma endosymbiont of Agriotes lineatus]|uniref:hypothetical protein n=1 Tax=Spiroplasma endosymbiont of Agriotes lineatus TaxID=3077930 RepID=UPI0030D12D92